MAASSDRDLLRHQTSHDRATVEDRTDMDMIGPPQSFIQVLEDPPRLVEIALIAIGMYLFVHTILRLTGSRTLAQITMFDIVVTIAIGNVFGQAIVSDSVTLFEGLLAIFVLVGLQWASDWITMKRPRLLPIVSPPPHLLYFEGRYLEDVMRSTRTTKGEIHDAMRRAGYAHEDEVVAVILERNGQVTVVPQKDRKIDPHGEKSTLSDPAKDLRHKRH